jgi:four helix bundle protein
MKINSFRDIMLWKESVMLVVNVYKITESQKLSRYYSLKEQIRKSAVSIPSNIAEGFERNNNNEFINFLRIAKASCAELLTQLIIAKEISALAESEYKSLEQSLTSLGFKMGGFLSYLKGKRRNKEFKLK